MEPTILIHGYSSESSQTDAKSIAEIYGTLPKDLERVLPGSAVVGINVTRYISLDDGVDLDDLSLSLDRTLQTRYPKLLESGFNVIIHSTGALVIRNWVRRHSRQYGNISPVRRIIHLAGANLGSGWAHIGETQLVKWLRFIGHAGEERGLSVLNGLEFGSNWTIDLHHHFLQPGNDMLADYGVMEFNIVGSQVPAQWMLVPFRYGKEDGSDGVVRVSSSNLNFNYLRIGPTEPHITDWEKAKEFSQRATTDSMHNRVTEMGTTATGDEEVFGGGYYTAKEDCRPGVAPIAGSMTRTRPLIPFAIPYQCAHSSDQFGVVYGTETRDDVLPLIKSALSCAPTDYAGQVEVFEAATKKTYDQVTGGDHSGSQLNDDRNTGILDRLGTAIDGIFSKPRAQYDKHAQIIVRVRDQNGKPITDYSIHFNSLGGGDEPDKTIDALFEDKHVNNASPNTITFYLRTDVYNSRAGRFRSRLGDVNGVDLEIDALDEKTRRILYVPLRMRIPSADLEQWIQPHRTTILDVQLLRLPSDDTFSM